MLGLIYSKWGLQVIISTSFLELKSDLNHAVQVLMRCCCMLVTSHLRLHYINIPYKDVTLNWIAILFVSKVKNCKTGLNIISDVKVLLFLELDCKTGLVLKPRCKLKNKT